MKYNENSLDSYVKSFRSDYKQAKFLVICFIFLIDFFTLIPNIDAFTGYNGKLLNITSILLLTIVILNNLYAIYFLIRYRNYKRIIVFHLFFGIMGITLALVFFQFSYVMMYSAYKLTPLNYIVLSILGCMLVDASFVQFIRSKLKKSSNNTVYGKGAGAITVIGGVGIIGVELNRIISRNTSAKTGDVISSILMLIVAVFFSLMVVSIYKYFLIKKYTDYHDEKF